MTSRHYLALVGAVWALAAGAPAYADTAPPRFAVQIEATSDSGGVHYLINVRNNTDAPASLAVVQRFAGKPSSVTASGDGKVQPAVAAWTLEVPPADINRVSSEARFGRGAATLSTVCVADAGTQQVLDCAADDLPPAALGKAKGGPLWIVVIGLIALGALLVGLAYAAIRWRSRWWPALRGWARTHPDTLAVVGSVLAVLLIGTVGFLVVAGRAQPFLADQAGTNKEAVGWAGEAHPLEVGRPANSRQAESTLYQWSCAAQQDAPTRCLAIVAVRNLTGENVPWVARMQRLRDSSGNWLQPDRDATLAANGGNDPFAASLAPHERRFATLVYQPKDPAALTRLELREGAFAAGVSLNLK